MTQRHPPGPKTWDLGWGLVREIRRDALGFYARMRDRHGDVVFMRFGPFRDYVVFHPDLVKEVLVTKAKHFRRHPLQMRVFRQWNGDSIVVAEGEAWLRQRRLVQPAFHPRRMQRYGRQMIDCTRAMLDGWKASWGASGAGEVEIVQAMTSLTINVIARTMFDVDLAHSAPDLRRAIVILDEVAMYEMLHLTRLPAWLPTPYQRRKRWAMQVLNGVVWSMIRERRASGDDHGDLLSTLLLARDEEGDGAGLSDEQVRNEAVTLLLAGHDTTAAGLSWLFFVIANHPDVKARVRQELDDVLGDRPMTADAAPRLKYLEMVLKETLRKYPPAIATFARQAAVDTEIGGYPIRKGGVVRTLSHPIHHDPRWFPDPEKFDPQRFSPSRVGGIPQYAYFPFGCGPRVCIGNTFAMMEMTLVAATVLQCVDVSLAPGQGTPELSLRLSLRPAGGLRMRVTPRRQAALMETPA